MVFDATRNDAGKMVEIRFDVEGNTVVTNPTSDPDANGANFYFTMFPHVGRAQIHPDPDAPVSSFALYAKFGERFDKP